MMAAEFLDANYDKVFAHYQRLLNSDNYVTRRQALKVAEPVGWTCVCVEIQDGPEKQGLGVPEKNAQAWVG